MRKSLTNGKLRVRAIAGTYVVILAWDFAPGEEAGHEGLLGFAIERTELKQGAVVERYWMRGIKRFREQGPGTAPRHAGEHRGPSDPVFPMGGLYRAGRPYATATGSCRPMARRRAWRSMTRQRLQSKSTPKSSSCSIPIPRTTPAGTTSTSTAA